MDRAHRYRVAVDIGGTFTDVAAFDEQTGRLLLGKWSTTPQNLVEGVLKAVDRSGAQLADASVLIHGSTIVINTVIERNGARTALITTRGFRDVYEIGRINRPESFNLFFKKHVPLIPRELRFEVTERIDAQGDVVVPFDEEEARALARQLESDSVDAVAILFLHSYRNPANEVRMRAILEEEAPKLFISVSHEISREYREYERTSTVAANAYVGPRVRQYLDELERRTAEAKFPGQLLMVQSNGGLYDASVARSQCIQMLESGPAAGIAGVSVICSGLGIENAIGFDMGGTTAKSGVIEGGRPRDASDYFVGGYSRGLALRIAALDIKEVGTGGGSIARVDAYGALHVGPESAGAEPGPVCYGRGGLDPTVTDADLLLGRIDDRGHLGGEIALDRELATRAIAERIARPLGLTPDQAATGIIQIANASMGYAVRAVTIERGLDPRDFVLVAYGGGGPLHAGTIARDLLIPTVIIPPAPALFSALGMLLADLRRDYVQTFFVRLRLADLEQIESMYHIMAEEGAAALRAAQVDLDRITVIRSADMRYVGQEHAVQVGVPADLLADGAPAEIKRAFDVAHELRYGHSAPNEEAELVSLRVAVVGSVAKPDFHQIARGGERAPEIAIGTPRRVYFDELGRFVDCPVYRREALLAGNRIAGPAVVDEFGTTTLVLPDDEVTVDEFGHLVMEIRRV